MQTIIGTDIQRAAELIRGGGIVAFPTETVFGLGASVLLDSAIANIYRTKGRPQDNPLIIHISSVEEVYQYADDISSEALDLCKMFWPGPLTVVCKAIEQVSSRVRGGLSSVALRVPAHPIALKLIEASQSGIVAPSANLSGKPSATTTAHVLTDFAGKIPYILEGDVSHGLESTIVDVRTSPFTILRLGAISRNEFLCKGLVIAQNSSEAHNFPGGRYKHYAPNGQVIICNQVPQLAEVTGKAAYIGLTPANAECFDLTLVCESVTIYARQLYSFFRRCDEEEIQQIYCELPPNSLLGTTVQDRLSKAANSCANIKLP